MTETIVTSSIPADTRLLRVHSYESLGTYDGPGIRLVVFLQGCNFRCLYCANPDTITMQGGTLTPIDEIVQKAVNERPFFGKKGGVTFSGGEPTLQAESLLPLVDALHEHNISVCIDTNGSIRTEAARELYRRVDLVLLDVKQFNPLRHRNLTGHDNSDTLATAAFLAEVGTPFWLRYVLVPGYSDDKADIEALCRHLQGNTALQRVEILPYHTLGMHKYEPLGMEYKLKDVPYNTPQQLEAARELFARYFADVRVN